MDMCGIQVMGSAHFLNWNNEHFGSAIQILNLLFRPFPLEQVQLINNLNVCPISNVSFIQMYIVQIPMVYPFC